MPLLPASLIEPLWVEFAALIESDRPEFDPTHPWGCHRRQKCSRSGNTSFRTGRNAQPESMTSEMDVTG